MIKDQLNMYMRDQVRSLDANDIIKEAMEYSLISNGKLIRPLVFLLFIKEQNLDYTKYFDIAMAIESIHVYSLIHDDLPAMDDDDMRRGRLTCHKMFSEDIAILAGDALLTYAFELLANAKVHAVDLVKIIYYVANHSGVNGGMINGQVLDIKASDVDVAYLEQVHVQKTARLLQLPFIIGTIVAKQQGQIKTCEQLGEALGLAYQIQDDYLDKYGDPSLLGKPVGSDALNDKVTYVDLFSEDEIVEKLRTLKKIIDQCADELKIQGELRNLIDSLEKRKF